MKSTQMSVFTRCLAGCLAVLIPLQVTLSCAPQRPAQETLSRVHGDETGNDSGDDSGDESGDDSGDDSDSDSDSQLDTEDSDSSTDTSPGEGWSDESDGNKTVKDWLTPVFPEFVDGFKEEPAEFPDLGYDSVFVPIGGTDLELKATPPETKGEPPLIEISLNAPSNTDKKDDDGKRPSFPLNPGKLKTKTEVQSDVQKRLVEREKTAKERQGTLGKQVGESEAKQKQAPPGELSNAVGGAQGEHSQAAGDIKGSLEKTVADATSGGDAPNGPGAGTAPNADTSPGLPPNGIPGKRGEKLARTRERANEAAAAGKNPFSKDLAKAAKGLLDDAEKKAREGNPNKADEKEKEARRLVDLAGIPPENMPPKPPPGEKPAGPGAPINERRGEAMGLGLDLYEAADDLTEAGLPDLGEKTRKAAAIAIDVAIGVARFSAFFDVPFSIMEAFGDVTLDVDDDGNPYLREPTKPERIVAVVNLGIIAGAAVLGGGVGGVVAAGFIGKIGKVIRGAEKSRALEKAALEAAEKGLVGAEKEALEKAAAELAEKEAAEIAKTASNLEKSKKTVKLTDDMGKKFSEGASAPDRGGYTRAGRALQKHSNRAGSAFPKSSGNPTNWNTEGQNIVESILKDPKKTVIEQSADGLGVFDVIAPDGRGLRFWGDGTLKGFLEPARSMIE